jgi:hypothetical protein
MSAEFRPQRSSAIRQMLLTHTTARRPWARALGSAALVALGLAVGATVSAAFYLQTPAPQPTATAGASVTAPPGVLPGGPIISALGTPVSFSTDGDLTEPLDGVPEGATHVRVSVVCLTAGTVSWGLDASGNNPSSGCTTDDLGTTSLAYFDFALTGDSPALYIGAKAGMKAAISYQYLNYVETAWGINASGQTYGVSKPDGSEPELVAVATVDGQLGYAYATALGAFGPDWPEQPSTPEEALAWQAERALRYPDGWDIPVFNPDGTTQIGVAHIANGG